MSFDYKAKRFARGGALPPLERHHAWKEIFSPDLRAELRAAPAPGGFDPLDVYRERYATTAGASRSRASRTWTAASTWSTTCS